MEFLVATDVTMTTPPKLIETVVAIRTGLIKELEFIGADSVQFFVDINLCGFL